MNGAGKSAEIAMPLDWGVAQMAMPGQNESGDLHLVREFQNGCLAAAVDGLGHGNEAALAARLAVAKMAERAHEPVIVLLQDCHEALRKTRGAAMSLASFNTLYNTLTWLGVGNVEGILVRADSHATPPRETIMLLGGVVGFNLPVLRATVTAVAPGDTLVLATDGIRPGWVAEVKPDDSPQHIADRICERFVKGTDDALVLVASYRGDES